MYNLLYIAYCIWFYTVGTKLVYAGMEHTRGPTLNLKVRWIEKYPLLFDDCSTALVNMR